ncbi:MAG: hypothetical protein KDA27_27290, partial [Candidatus Eisenbacteria bacterium]|nr:hypothetical protein [Candidatus Eisenbacteria bacterium]
MTIKVLVEKGQSRRSIARALDLDESTVRYHAKRLAEGATDGRSKQQQRAEAWSSKIEYYLEALDDEPLNLTELHEWLCEEHGYGGSLRSVQRYFRKHYPGPKKRARRRIETPPGAQAQVDWAEWPKLLIGGRQVYGYEFHMRLSHSRYGARVWSPRKDQLAWQTVHNEAFRRIDGVAATVRVDNEKTAMSRGAGSWGEFNPSYYRYAKRLRFHIDPCPPRGAMKKTSPKLDLDQTREKLDKVGLVRASEHLDVLLAEAVKEETAPHLFLDKILEQELSFREERRVRTSLKLSGLPTGQTLSNFDFSFQPSIERSRIETL